MFISLDIYFFRYLFLYIYLYIWIFLYLYLSKIVFAKKSWHYPIYIYLSLFFIITSLCNRQNLLSYVSRTFSAVFYNINVNACIFSKIRSLSIYKYMWPFNHKKRQLPEYRSCLNIWMKCCIHYRFWWYGKVHAIDTRIHEKNNNWKRIDKNQQESWTGSPVRRSDHAKQILPSHSLPSVQYTK